MMAWPQQQMQPGGRLTRRMMAMAQPIDTSTVPGGLAHVLQQAVLGYQTGRDERRDRDTMQRVGEVLTGPGVDPAMEGYGDSVPPMDAATRRSLAARLLMENPNMAQMGWGMTMQGFQDDARAAERAEDRDWRQQEAAAQRDFQREQAEAQRAAQREMQAERLAVQRELQRMRGAAEAGDPAAVREFRFFQGLAPEQQREFLLVKRANPYLNLGDVYAQPDPLVPGQATGQFSMGIGPERRITDDRAMTFPGVSGEELRGAGPSFLPEGAAPAAVPQPPPGGMSEWDGSRPAMRAPGEPAITELPPTRREREAAEAAQRSRARAGGTVIQDVGRALNIMDDAGRFATGRGAVLGLLDPESNASTLNQLFDSIRGNIGVDQLQGIRESSPTGGALGNVTERQLEGLQGLLGRLDVRARPEITRDNLRRIANLYMDIVHGDVPHILATAEGLGLSDEEIARLTFRYDLSFDEMGNPIEGRQQAEPPAPAQGGWSIRRLD